MASWLCPPRLRPPIAAIYRFARAADDVADEGDATPEQRLRELATFRDDLAAAGRGHGGSGAYRAVFEPLATAMRAFALPESLLADLLSAFTQDVEMARDRRHFTDRTALLDYCARSANPVGRLLLHLYGVTEAVDLVRSDAVCSALQLINFWQDPSVDLPRGRLYFPLDDCERHGIAPSALLDGSAAASPAVRRLVADEVAWARELMSRGAPLVHRVPGRMGWELRLVVQGGLRILDRIEGFGFDALRRRPTLRPVDAPLLAWRALRM